MAEIQSHLFWKVVAWLPDLLGSCNFHTASLQPLQDAATPACSSWWRKGNSFCGLIALA
jgi:hypothetical protein